MRKIKFMSIGVCCLIFIAAVIFHCVRLSYNEMKVPVKKWSKSLKLSEVKILSEHTGCKVNGNLISVFINKENVEIVKLTELGEILKRGIIAEGKHIQNLRVMAEEDNLKIMYTEWSDDKRKLSMLTLDKEFKIIEREERFDVIEAKFLNEDRICVLKKGSLEIINWNGKIEASFESSNLSKLEVVKSDGEYFIVVIKNTGEVLSSSYKVGDKSIKFKEIHKAKVGSFKSIRKMYLGVNGEQIYILLEMYNKNKYDGIDIHIYSKKDGEMSINKIELSKKYKMKDFVMINNEGEFLCSIQRVVRRGEKKYDLARVRFKGSEIEKIEYLTRSITDSRYPRYLKDTITFTEKKDSKNINLALISTSDNVKSIVNNKINQDEKSYIVNQIITFIIYSIIFSFLLGWVWMIAGIFVFIGITMINERSFDKKKKVRMFILGCLIMMLFKNYEIYGMFYVSGKVFMTGVMSNQILGMGISVCISIITVICACIGYKNDCESIPFLKFIIWFIPDVVLTMTFLYPYIII
ncbi:hypothetical protein [Oceanirhabdus sp. W0125-5]|uniref:hypothetical protein n=1 Tax=Oceanirhabdus sp. W0125-5 TaxID=2999116 RepID=UPI0022F2EA54|nr:hypothetical protein [Oceanirhabdus sp. W0125-5]WBW99195.1 hypothetical protein OW730_10735 [Oceanirhabdus sp. W0125-5]